MEVHLLRRGDRSHHSCEQGEEFQSVPWLDQSKHTKKERGEFRLSPFFLLAGIIMHCSGKLPVKLTWEFAGLEGQ